MPSLFKECVTCKVPRDAETEFHSNGQYYKDGVKKKRKDCVYCCRERRSNYFKNPVKKDLINKRRRRNYSTDGGARRERNRKNSLKQLYGLTVEQYDDLRKQQDYKCAICNIHEKDAVRGKLYVDHSHITGENRGLLCAKCNSALGLFKENVVTMQNAVKFLKKHG